MNKKQRSIKQFLHKNKFAILGTVCVVIALPLVAYAIFEGVYWNKVYPGVKVAGLSVAGMKREEVSEALKQVTAARLNAGLTVTLSTGQKLELGKVQDYANYDLAKSADVALLYGRKSDWFASLKEQLRGVVSSQNITPVYSFNHQAFDEDLANAVRPFERPVVDSQLALAADGVYLSASQNGFEGNRDETISAVASYLMFQKDSANFNLALRDENAELTEENSKEALEKAKVAISRPLTLKSPYLANTSWTLNKEQLFSLMTLKKVDSKVQVVFDDYKVASYSGQIAQLVNRDPVDAKFQLDGERVSVFEPASPGLALDTENLTKLVAERAFNPATAAEIEIPVKTTEPALSTENVNNYGIKELVAQGKSKFSGSPSGRVHNLALASSKLNGVLIAPGETFSMYKVVGEVEQSTGYQDAFIIKDGRTVPGVGGGLCQVSTTLFRAVLNAGLPIVERHQHAYRVYYYEQDSAPGIDAAVYFPSWDFKFKNDTGNYLLLQTKVDTQKMTAEFNLYGVKDGRKVEISKPVVSNQAPPPPELRIDDPTLPRGQEKEVDHAVWGADTIFSRTVTRDGEQLLKDEFVSKYKPWQRVVMVGVKDN